MKTIRRRRLEAKTDYKARFSMLKSEMPRLVVRRTNRYLIAQIVESDIAQDKVIVGVNSKDLLEHGWPKEKSGSLKSLQAAYLTGFLLGKNSKLKSKELILDLGLQRTAKGSRLFAVVKGALDAGLKIPHKKEILPTEERMSVNKDNHALMKKIKEKL